MIVWENFYEIQETKEELKETKRKLREQKNGWIVSEENGRGDVRFAVDSKRTIVEIVWLTPKILHPS